MVALLSAVLVGSVSLVADAANTQPYSSGKHLPSQTSSVPIQLAQASQPEQNPFLPKPASPDNQPAPAHTSSPVQTLPQSAPLPPRTGKGQVLIDIRDVVDKPLISRVRLVHKETGFEQLVDVPAGRLDAEFPAGAIDAYVQVLDAGVPITVAVKKLDLPPNDVVGLPVRLLEGAGKRALRAFDQDFDLVLDSAELEAGTDPADPRSVPGQQNTQWPSPVLGSEGRWYHGELHAHSNHGIGRNSVKQLVQQAEKMKLDFLAVTDRNTLAAAHDPGFQSSSVVLIPALEWGTDDKGVALLYGPLSVPRITDNAAEAQAICIRTQAQGGVFAIAHPCFATAPWQWPMSFFNAVEVWCRDWREVPPLWSERLDEATRARIQHDHHSKPVYSVARAAATGGLSANGQAALFWDLELSRGMKASAIAGSNAVNATEMGRPLTFVYAEEKSLNGILEGLRFGRTFVTTGIDGPRVSFTADMLDDGTINVGVGGGVPLHVPTRFYVQVENALGKRLEVLLNGLPIRSTAIDRDKLGYSFMMTPESYSVFRVRVVERAATPDFRQTLLARNDAANKTANAEFGVLDVLAMSSPIYAQEMVPVTEEWGTNVWIEVDSQYSAAAASGAFLPRNPEAYEIKPEWSF